MSMPSWCARSDMFTVRARGYGECRITSLHDRFGTWIRVHVDQADPCILISRVLFSLWWESGGAPLYSNPLLTVRSGPGREESTEFSGWTVTIRGENRTVLYRLGRYLPELDAYEAQWPD
jgi:hypothetical protein